MSQVVDVESPTNKTTRPSSLTKHNNLRSVASEDGGIELSLNGRPLGTPYIEKKGASQKLIKPAQANISYCVTLKSPLEQMAEAFSSPEIKPSAIESVKSPHINPRDIYDKELICQLSQQRYAAKKPPKWPLIQRNKAGGERHTQGSESDDGSSSRNIKVSRPAAAKKKFS